MIPLAFNLPQQQLGATDANRVASQLKQHRDPYCFRRSADVDVLANVRFTPEGAIQQLISFLLFAYQSRLTPFYAFPHQFRTPFV